MAVVAPSAMAAVAMSDRASPSSTPLVVRREKRRRQRKVTHASSTSAESGTRAVRHGFVFDDTADDKAERSVAHSGDVAAATALPSVPSTGSSHTFVFRVRKSSKKNKIDVDPTSASDALLMKKERAAKLQLRRLRQQQKQEEQEAEEKFESAIVGKLSEDQMELYHTVRDHVKRELRKTRKEFANSAARADIIQLTEKSLHALKAELVDFMKQNGPSLTMVTVPNPENARLAALVKSYEARIQELGKEEAQWTEMLEGIEHAGNIEHASQESQAEMMDVDPAQPVTCELTVTREVEEMQRTAISNIETSTQRLLFIEDSMKTIDRLILQAEIKKSKLFDTFHGSAFKGYVNMQDPKETLRALLKLAPVSTPSRKKSASII